MTRRFNVRYEEQPYLGIRKVVFSKPRFWEWEDGNETDEWLAKMLGEARDEVVDLNPEACECYVAVIGMPGREDELLPPGAIGRYYGGYHGPPGYIEVYTRDRKREIAYVAPGTKINRFIELPKTERLQRRRWHFGRTPVPCYVHEKLSEKRTTLRLTALLEEQGCVAVVPDPWVEGGQQIMPLDYFL